jgi:hypothetical protein
MDGWKVGRGVASTSCNLVHAVKPCAVGLPGGLGHAGRAAERERSALAQALEIELEKEREREAQVC